MLFYLKEKIMIFKYIYPNKCMNIFEIILKKHFMHFLL